MGLPASSSDANGTATLKQIAFLLKLIIVAIILAFCWEAGSVCISIVLSALLAVLVDPVMVFMEKLGLGRTFAAAVSVLCFVLVMAALAYGLYEKADAFAAQLPTYSYRIRKALRPLTDKVERLEQGAETLTPNNNDHSANPVSVRVTQAVNWPALVYRGVGSISGFLVIAGIAPFLAFFMLLRKERMFSHFQTFFEGKIDTGKFLRGVRRMVRGYVVGNLVLGLGLSIAMIAVFLSIGLHNAVPLGLLCGFLNTIPFVGGIIATVVALAAGLLQFAAVGPFIVIAMAIPALHLIALNFVFPRIVGPRLLIGPVATTVGMLFWGWLWGVMGLFLAVPLTAFLKLIGDAHPRLGWLSQLLAEGPQSEPTFIDTTGRALERIKHYLRDLYFKHRKHQP